MYTKRLAAYMRELIRWILSNDLVDEYLKGWKDSANQHHHEPATAGHGIMARSESWGEE